MTNCHEDVSVRHGLETLIGFNLSVKTMDSAYLVLLSSAVTLGVLHTAVGIDHSLPFVVLGATRGWSLAKTLLITGLCGVLHVLSSVVIAGVGLSLGVAASRIGFVESMRGSSAAWLLVSLGTIYTAVALWKRKAHRALPHVHGAHGHGSREGWHELSERADQVSMPARSLMPALFVIFALGPCEALLPLLTASGVALSPGRAAVVALVFSIATVATMLLTVSIGVLGASFAKKLRWQEALEPHAHTLAGVSLIVSGLAIQVLGI